MSVSYDSINNKVSSWEQYPKDAAALIVRYLEKLGIEYIFGIPGGAIEPLYNALAKSTRKDGLKIVGACHEAAAAYMADGYQRESGKLGVCIATSGPGATNLITGVSCAYANNIPLLVITGQPTIASFGKGALQESACTGVNILGMFRHCTKYNSLVSHVDQLETKLVTAILKAYQTSGPVHLSIPVDILRSPVTPKQALYDLNQQIKSKKNVCDETTVEALYSELLNNHDPLFFIGSGTSSAIENIMILASLCKARFITTPDAKGLVNIRHKLYRGVFGLGGHAGASLTLRHHNSITVAFGTGFSEFYSAGWSNSLMNSKLIHLDSQSDNLLQTPMAKLHALGNINTICKKLIEKFEDSGRKYTSDSTQYFQKHNPNIVFDDALKYAASSTPIKPQRLMKELSERFPENTRFVADAGNSMMWAPHYLQPNNQRERNGVCLREAFTDRRSKTANWLRLTLDFAPMGWAIGASIGIARANPTCPVVCITGDGSYLMSGQEITVAARERLPVVFVILNDSVYGMVMHGQRLAGAEPIGFQLPKVNYASLANSLGISSYTIHSPEDFDQLDMPSLIKKSSPALLDIHIDKEEVPPMITRLKTLGTVEDSLAS